MRSSAKTLKPLINNRNIAEQHSDWSENSVSIKHRINHAEERVSDLEHRTFEMIHSEDEKIKMKKSEESLWDL